VLDIMNRRANIVHRSDKDVSETITAFMDLVQTGRGYGEMLDDTMLALLLLQAVGRAGDEWQQLTRQITSQDLVGKTGRDRLSHTIVCLKREQDRINVAANDNKASGKSTTASTPTTDRIAKLEEDLMKAQETIAALSLHRNGNGNGTSNVTCWNCGKRGHISRLCKGACGTCGKQGHKKNACKEKDNNANDNNGKVTKRDARAVKQNENISAHPPSPSVSPPQLKATNREGREQRSQTAAVVAQSNARTHTHTHAHANNDESSRIYKSALNDDSVERCDVIGIASEAREPQHVDESVANIAESNGSHRRRGEQTGKAWNLDSACTRHACCDAGKLQDYRKTPLHPGVKLADGSKINVDGEGNTEIVSDAGTLTLTNVMHVPASDLNLVSVRQLNDDGYDVTFESGNTSGVITMPSDNDRIVARAPLNRNTGLYQFETVNRFAALGADTDLAENDAVQIDMWDEHVNNNNRQNNANNNINNGAITSTPTQKCNGSNITGSKVYDRREWHTLLGHASLKKIDSTIRAFDPQAVIQGELNLESCEACHYGKETRQPITKKMTHTRSTTPNERIYSDISGPFMGWRGLRYRLSLIDDCTDYAEVKFLEKKSDTFEEFKAFIAKTERQHGEKVKILHTDNGGEYVSNEMEQLQRELGIIPELTDVNEPRQNGRAERFNRTIDEKASCMLADARLSERHYSILAQAHAVDVHNCMEDKGGSGKSRYEQRWNKRAPLNELKPFGAVAYMMLSRQSREKHGQRTLKTIYVGRAPNKRGHMVVDPTTGRIFTSRNVTFDCSLQSGHGQGRLGRLGNGKLVVVENHLTHISPQRPEQAQDVHEETIDLNTGAIDDDDDDDINNDIVPTTEQVIARPAEPHVIADSNIPTLDQRHVTTLWAPAVESTTTTTTVDNSNNIETSDTRTTTITTPTEPRRSSRQRAPVKRYDGDGGEWTYSAPAANVKTTDGVQNETNGTSAESQGMDTAAVITRCRSILEQVQLSCENTTPEEFIAMLATIASITGEAPTSMVEIQAIDDDETRRHWIGATDTEMDAILKNETYELVPKPAGANVIGCKWVLKIKRGKDGEITRYKARIVAQGFSQRKGVDYHETFAPTVAFSTFRTTLFLALALGFKFYRGVDVSNAYLNSELDHDAGEKIYMRQPPGYEKKGKEHWVCLLRKTLYGLKQSGNKWNKRLVAILVKIGMTQSKVDPALFVMYRNDKIVALINTYVDDCPLMAIDDATGNKIIKGLEAELKITVDPLEFFVGIKINIDIDGRRAFLSQEAYVDQVLERFNMTHVNEAKTPQDPHVTLSKEMEPSTDSEKQDMARKPYRELVGALNYLACATRGEISNAIKDCSRYMNNPGPSHWTAAKRILRYLKGTKALGLCVDARGVSLERGRGRNMTMNVPLVVYADADFATDPDTRRSTSGHLTQVNGTTLSYKAKLNPHVTTSSTESETVAGAMGVQSSEGTRQLLNDIGIQTKATILHQDNQPSILWAESAKSERRAKHIDVKWFYTREQIANGNVVVQYCPTAEMVADILTKGSFTVDQFRYLRDRMSIRSPSWMKDETAAPMWMAVMRTYKRSCVCGI
jgi:transposase InsO family protein